MFPNIGNIKHLSTLVFTDGNMKLSWLLWVGFYIQIQVGTAKPGEPEALLDSPVTFNAFPDEHSPEGTGS